jgi:hypothetical protein
MNVIILILGDIKIRTSNQELCRIISYVDSDTGDGVL